MSFSNRQNTIRARLDNRGCILSADPQLLDLHIDNGGEEGGVLAVPALLDLAMRSRQIDMRLSRPVSAQSGEAQFLFWAKIQPDDAGVDIELGNWTESAKEEDTAGGDVSELQSRRDDVQRIAADGQIKLDAAQKIISLDFREAGPDIAPNDYILRSWTDIFEFPALVEQFGTAKQPLNWQVFDGQLMTFSGYEKQWKAKISPIVSGDARPDGFNVYLTEIRAASEKTDSEELLGDVQLEKLFSGQLGSSLRQPIGRIIANAETIGEKLQGPIRSDYASYAKDIAQAGQHLLELVEDLSDLEIVEREDFAAEKDEIDLADLARRASGLLALKASDHNIRIDAPAEDESLPAVGEFRRVLQILLNLITNAIRYSPDGSMVWLRLEKLGDRAQIIVADQGSGISEEDQSRVFDKFERLGRSGDGGSGLGLYISRKLARAMDGDLKIESAPGQGARFILELPSNPKD